MPTGTSSSAGSTSFATKPGRHETRPSTAQKSGLDGRRDLDRGIGTRADRDEVDVLAETGVDQVGSTERCPPKKITSSAVRSDKAARTCEIAWSRRTWSSADAEAFSFMRELVPGRAQAVG